MKKSKFYLIFAILLCGFAVTSCKENVSEPIELTPEQELHNRLAASEWVTETEYFTNNYWDDIPPFLDSGKIVVIFKKNTDTIQIIEECTRREGKNPPAKVQLIIYTFTYKITSKYTFHIYGRHSSCAVLFHTADSITITKFIPNGIIIMNYTHRNLTLHRRKK